MPFTLLPGVGSCTWRNIQEFIVAISLCGQSPCPRVCTRVCHCPAGLLRSREQFAMYRNRREISQTRVSPYRPVPPGENPITGEISQTRHYLGQLKEGVLYNLIGAKKYPVSHKPTKYVNRCLKPLASWAILTGFLAFMSIVILIGLLVYGPSLSPTYEIEPVYTPPYWMENR